MHVRRNSEVALHRCSWGKSVLSICSKFTGEHPCRNVISIKLQSCNFIEIILEYGCSPIISFSIWVLFHEHSRITGLQGKGEGISLTPHYHFYPLHRPLGISWVITAESSPLHIANSQTWTGNHWLLNASH